MSYESCFDNKDYVLADTSVVPGLLNVCDILDLAALTGADVKFIDPFAADNKVMSNVEAEKYFKDTDISVDWTWKSSANDIVGIHNVDITRYVGNALCIL